MAREHLSQVGGRRRAVRVPLLTRNQAGLVPSLGDRQVGLQTDGCASGGLGTLPCHPQCPCLSGWNRGKPSDICVYVNHRRLPLGLKLSQRWWPVQCTRLTS